MSEAGPPGVPASTQTTNPDLGDPGRIGLVGRLKRLKRPIVAVAAVGAVLSGLVGYWTTYRSFRDGADLSTVNAASGQPPVMSIALLPFIGVEGKAPDELLAQSLTHDVTSALARSARYALVASYGSVSNYKGKTLDARTA